MNILYTLSGFGFGHSTRSKVVIDYLKKRGHKVKIATYGQSIQYFKNIFPNDLIEIKGLAQAFLSDRVFATGTVLRVIKNIPALFGRNFYLFKKIIKNFQIDVIFNDFEPSARWFARINKVPLVTFDNQSLSYFCQLDVPTKFLTEHWTLNGMMNFFYPWGDWRFIASFAPKLTPTKKRFSPNTFVVPAPLRQEIFNFRPQKENFILVYQTIPIYKEKLIETFLKSSEKFICYNLGRASKYKNIIFKNFSQDEFLSDLSRAKAVILNGGFSLMSEALYFKKPILSLPIKGDFEQILNGLLLQKSGWGMFAEKFNENILYKFLRNIPDFEAKLTKHQQNKNVILERKLDRVLAKIEFNNQLDKKIEIS